MRKSLLPSLMSAFRAGCSAVQDSRLGSRHTNWPSLWQGATRDIGRRPASSILTHLPSMRSGWKTRAISSMMATNRADKSSRRRATKSSYSSLGLIGCAQPYVPPSLNTLGNCQTNLDAIVIGETKCRDVITKLNARRCPSALSVSPSSRSSSIS
jgi:hypothetical protein